MTDLQKWAADELDRIENYKVEAALISFGVGALAFLSGGVFLPVMAAVVPSIFSLQLSSNAVQYYIRELRKIREGNRFTKVTEEEATRLYPL